MSKKEAQAPCCRPMMASLLAAKSIKRASTHEPNFAQALVLIVFASMLQAIHNSASSGTLMTWKRVWAH